MSTKNQKRGVNIEGLNIEGLKNVLNHRDHCTSIEFTETGHIEAYQYMFSSKVIRYWELL